MAKKNNEFTKVYIVRKKGYYIANGSNDIEPTTKTMAFNNKDAAWTKFRNECFLEWNRITQKHIASEVENKGQFLFEHPWDESWLDECKAKFFDDNNEMDFTFWNLEGTDGAIEWTYKEEYLAAKIQLFILDVFPCAMND